MTVICDLLYDINENEWTFSECCLESWGDRQYQSWVGTLKAIWKILWRKPWRRRLGRLKAISTQTLYTTWKLAKLKIYFHIDRCLFFSVAKFTNPLLYKCLNITFRLGGSPLYHQIFWIEFLELDFLSIKSNLPGIFLSLKRKQRFKK